MSAPLSRKSTNSSTVMTSQLSQKRKSSASIKSVRSVGSLRDSPLGSSYADTCEKYKTRPSPFVKFNLKTNSVEVHGDRMRGEEWQAIMEALSTDVSTHHVRIKNKRYMENLNISYDTLTSVMAAPKNVPVLSTLYVVTLIASSAYELLINSLTLVYLELENVRFDERSLDLLVTGVEANRTLQHLSLAYSRIGDAACLALCRSLRDKPNVLSVDLSGCCLTAAAASPVHGLVDVVKKQQIKRHEECWAHSLRCRVADPGVMRGLRRLTLNDNGALGDGGVAELFEALKDDYYVKALDLQNCGLTDRGAGLAASALAVNDSLVVLDVRGNERVSSDALATVMARLCENNAGNPETKQWTWTKPVGDRRGTTSCGSSSSILI